MQKIQILRTEKIYKAIVIRTKKHIKRANHKFSFLENAAILLDAQLNTLGNRIFGATIRLYDNTFINHKKIINITEKSF